MRKKGDNRLIVGSVTWAQDLPKWLLDEIVQERLVLGLGQMINPECYPAGDAEVLAYLMTCSNRAPLPHNRTQIMCHLTGVVMKRKGKEVEGLDDIVKKELSPDELHELHEIRRMIYNARGDVSHPLLDMMREMKKTAEREDKKNG